MTRTGKLAVAVDVHGGNGYGAVVVREARAAGILVSLGCALVEHESGFKNVFGHDPVRRPQLHSPAGGVLGVTHARYRRYKLLRRLCGAQGVGLTQLTAPGFQDAADRLGGCWKPTYQLRVGFMDLARMVALHGEERGLASYNAGEGNWRAGLAYASAVRALQHDWHLVLAA